MRCGGAGLRRRSPVASRSPRSRCVEGPSSFSRRPRRGWGRASESPTSSTRSPGGRGAVAAGARRRWERPGTVSRRSDPAMAASWSPTRGRRRPRAIRSRSGSAAQVPQRVQTPGAASRGNRWAMPAASSGSIGADCCAGSYRCRASRRGSAARSSRRGASSPRGDARRARGSRRRPCPRHGDRPVVELDRRHRRVVEANAPHGLAHRTLPSRWRLDPSRYRMRSMMRSASRISSIDSSRIFDASGEGTSSHTSCVDGKYG